MNGKEHTCVLASGVAPATCIACATMPFEEWLAARGIKADDSAWKTRDDKPLPEDQAIDKAFPTRTGRHDLYQEAMRLVGARFSKSGLVGLVNWLLAERDRIETATIEACIARLESRAEHFRFLATRKVEEETADMHAAEDEAEELQLQATMSESNANDLRLYLRATNHRIADEIGRRPAQEKAR